MTFEETGRAIFSDTLYTLLCSISQARVKGAFGKPHLKCQVALSQWRSLPKGAETKE